MQHPLPNKPIPALTNHTIYWLTIPACIALLVAVCLAFIVPDKNPDEKIFNLLTPHISAATNSLMIKISFLANHKFLIPIVSVIIICLLLKKIRWAAFTIAMIMLSSIGLTSLLKNLIRRLRPPAPLVEGITNFSFPSGHAFMSVAFYGMLIWFTYHYISGKWLRNIIIILLLLLIATIGFSRIYLRVHYTTDVVAGFCFGLVWLVLCLSFFSNRQLPGKLKSRTY